MFSSIFYQVILNSVFKYIIFFKSLFGILAILSLILTSSCIQKDLSRYGRLKFYNSIDKKSFSFTVNDEYIKKIKSAKKDKKHTIMTKAEAKLLTKLLKNNNYCINKNGKLSFFVKSKQERVYDITFSSLIDKHYNAKPLTPVTYFGECR